MSVTFSAQSLDLDAPEVNMSNRNALPILDMLGVIDDPCDWAGTCPAEDFLGRVKIAQALAPRDEGMPGFVEAVFGRATIVHGGRRKGYTQDVLVRLEDLAGFCRDNDMNVQWY